MRAVSALFLFLLPATASAQAMPKLKAGMWETVSAMEGMPAEMRKPSYMCIDDATQARWSVLGQQAGNCSTTQMQRTPDGLRYSSTCNMRGMKTTTNGVMKGDFNSRYEMTSTTTGIGPKPTVVHATARYMGACQGLKPGQMKVMGMVIEMKGGR